MLQRYAFEFVVEFRPDFWYNLFSERRRKQHFPDFIKEKKYLDFPKDYKGGLLFVGVNYDKKDKTHECRIERFEKCSRLAESKG